MRDYGYALALGELYRPEQIGVFKYSLENQNLETLS